MQNDSKVYFKATKDSIVVMLNSDIEFLELKEALYSKALEAKKFFGNKATSVSFKGRDLSEIEERLLIRTIEEATDLRVLIVRETLKADKIDETNESENGELQELEAHEELLELEYEDSCDTDFDSNYMNVEKDYCMGGFLEIKGAPHTRRPFDMEGAIFYNGSLRSGMCLECEGSVVILGDVNPGGEVIAGGNIVVLGILKGLAHAGAYGGKNAFVAAISLQPVQLRIGNIITTVAEELDKRGNRKQAPSYAYIYEDQIYIAPLI